MENRSVLRLLNFFIFNSNYAKREGEEEKKILFFYPSKTTLDEKIKSVGLCEALIKFTSSFSKKPCEVLHTQRTRKVFFEAAVDFWMVMTVSVPSETKQDGTVDYKDEEVQDVHCLSVLKQSYDMFKLFMGPIASILQKSNVNGLKQRFEHFFNRYVYSITIDQTDILDVFHGLRFLPLDKNAFLRVQCFVNQIEAAFPAIKYTAFFYNDNLIWCALDPEDMQIIYRYLTTSLFPAHPEQDPTRVSVSAKHMGLFIAGPPDLSKPDNFGKIPKLYLTGKKGKLEICTLIVYRALHASMCFFLDSSSRMPFDFYVTLDQMLGPELTQLAEAIATSYTRTSSLTPPESLNFKYVYFNHMNRALKSTVHLDCNRKTGTLSVPPALLRSILDVKVEMEEYIHNEHCEVITKTSHDNWIVAKKSDKREVYIIIVQKNLNLIEVHDEAKRLCSSQFSNIFFLD